MVALVSNYTKAKQVQDGQKAELNCQAQDTQLAKMLTFVLE